MADTGDSLRALYALRLPEASGHVGEDDWVTLASGDAPAAAREQAFDHVVRCTACARIYRGLSELEEGARAFDRSVPEALAPAPIRLLDATRWGWWGGLAAAAVVMWVIVHPRSALAPTSATVTAPATSELRGGGDARPALVEPLGPVAVWPARLRWQPVAQTRGYRVRVLDGEGNEIWASPVVADTTLAWPVQVAPRPGRVYWQVTAYPQGRGDAEGVPSILASFDYQP